MYRKTKYGNTMKPTYRLRPSYDDLITGYSGITQSKGQGGIPETVSECINIIKKQHHHVQKLAKFLKARTLLQSCYNIWYFLQRTDKGGNINYYHDTPGTEELRTPARSWHDRKTGIDCDDFAILVSSLLIEMNHKPTLYTVSFDNKRYSHIYVGAGKSTITDGKPDAEVLIDPVEQKFFFSTYPVKKTIKYSIMKINTLGQSLEDTPLNGVLGSAIADATSQKLLKLREKTKSRKTKSKIDLLLQYNGSVYRYPLERIMPYVDEVLPDGRLAFQNEQIGHLMENFLTEADSIIEEAIMGLSDIDGLGKSWFGKVLAKIGKAATKVVDKIKDKAKKVWKGIKKVTLAIPRNAFLLLVKFNGFGLATKLYIGTLSEADANTKGLVLDQWRKAVGSYNKTRTFFEKCGGNPKNLDTQISKGWLKAPLLSKKAKRIQELLKKTPATVVEKTKAVDAAQKAKALKDHKARWIKANPGKKYNIITSRKRSSNVSGLGFAAAATGATAAPFLTKVVMWLKNINFGKLLKTVGSFTKKEQEDKSEEKYSEEAYGNGSDDDDMDIKSASADGTNLTPILIAAAAAVGLILLTKK